MSAPLIAAAASYWRLTEDELLGPRRFPALVKARTAIAHVLRERDGLPYAQIGLRLGGRDHSTIISNLRDRHDRWMQDDRHYRVFAEAQMALPKFHKLAAFLPSPFGDVRGLATPSKVFRVLPPCPAHLVKLRKQTTPKKPPRETIRLTGHQFSLDENGVCWEEHFSWENVQKGTKALLSALRREHPERCVA